jgi:hypothetical protein
MTWHLIKRSGLASAGFLFSLFCGLHLHAVEFRVDDAGRHLLLNGKPFFWLADTAWLLAQVPSRDDLEIYLEARRKQGFTVIQLTAVMSEERVWGTTRATTLGDTPFLDGNPLRPAVTPGGDPRDPASYDYWDHFDYVIERIHAHGLRAAVVAMFVGSGGDGFKFLRRENARQYGRFLGERQRSKPQVIWILGGDNTPDSPEKKDIWNLMAKGITEGACGREDYAETLMTYHINGGSSSSQFWHDSPWLDFNMTQTWSAYPEIYQTVRNDYGKTPAKPCGLGEGAYEDGPQYPTKPIDDVVIRKQAYWSFFAGGYHTYGNGNVWHFDTFTAELTQPWKQALQSAGALEMITLRKFFDSIGWANFVPDSSLSRSAPRNGGPAICAMRSTDRAQFVFYVTTTNVVESPFGSTSESPALQGKIVNPRTGEEHSLEKEFVKSSQIKLPTAWNDGLIWIRK